MPTVCVIVDDEPIARDVIRQHLEKVPDCVIGAECRNALEALDWLSGHHADLMFLDIQMPHLSGIDLIKTLLHPPKVILVTAYREYALEGFDLDVVDYLLKPVSFERFLRAMYRYLTSGVDRDASFHMMPVDDTMADPFTGKTLDVREQYHLVSINLTGIHYIESLRDYVRIHLDDRQVVTKLRIGYLEITLPDALFLRIHKSYLIGIRYITAYSSKAVELGDLSLPVGRTYRKRVVDVLKKYRENKFIYIK